MQANNAIGQSSLHANINGILMHPCRLYERLTLDVITNCGFGLEAEALKNSKDPFLERCRGVLESTTRFSILFLLGCKLLTDIMVYYLSPFSLRKCLENIY